MQLHSFVVQPVTMVMAGLAHCAEPALSLSRGRASQKQKRGGLRAGLFPQRLRVLIVPTRGNDQWVAINEGFPACNPTANHPNAGP